MFASKDVFLNPPSGGYTISRSVRLRSSASAYFNRTPASATNQKTFTFSAWLKRGSLSGDNTFFCARQLSTSTPYFYLSFDNSTNILSLNSNNGTLYTTAVYRDPSAWYHVVYAIDTTQATSSNRIKLYVNGSQVTTFGTATYPSLNADMGVNSTIAHWIGAVTNGIGTISQFFDGYLAEINFIDGQALTPSSFGAISTNGVWQPTAYIGTYGTNGFYLKFADNSTAAALGTDSSGNSNTWTVNNISVTAGVTYDSMTDVPMLTSATAANYPTWNPLWQGRTNVPTNGNLDYPASSVGIGTMALSGSSYWEITSTGGTSTVALYSTAVSTSQAVTTGLTYGFRFNATTGAFDYTTNGSSFTSIATGLTSGPYFFYVSTAASTTASLNAGQRPFANTAPTGFVALNTYNLSTPTIANGAAYMAATLYTGNGSTQSITNTVNGVSFQPDWVWAKNRSAAYEGGIYDVLRGTGNTASLTPSSTRAESGNTTDFNLTSFNSSGFSLGTTSGTNVLNRNGDATVAWQWKANGAGVTNTSGSITSTVSAGTTQGFSVVTYTGTGANATVGHGLGVAPSMIITKNRGAVSDWGVYHTSLGNTNYVLLNSTVASAASSTYWNNTSPTSSVFSIGTATPVNVSTNTYVAYCFAAVAGYSAFGSYTGNGSTDGPFVYLGFRPRWVLIKRFTDLNQGWQLYDNSRNPYNTETNLLFPDGANAEQTGNAVDVLSNGFKLRSSDTPTNSSGIGYIYAAFAENPFKYSLAR